MENETGREFCKSCRSPCGERGLKYEFTDVKCLKARSLPVRGAWVEISSCLAYAVTHTPSLPVRGAWVEMPIFRHS